jgi:hypothetical protein
MADDSTRTTPETHGNDGIEEDDPEAPLYSSVPLDLGDGEEVVIQQQNTGKDNEEGGGEWPDPETPPKRPAPGPA